MRGFNKRASNLLANLKTDESALAKFASVASQQLDDLTHVSCSTSCAQRMLMLLDASLWRSWRPPADCCVNGRLGCKMFSSDRFMSGSPDVLRCSVAFFGLRANLHDELNKHMYKKQGPTNCLRPNINNSSTFLCVALNNECTSGIVAATNIYIHRCGL